MHIANDADLAENKLTILYISKIIGFALTNERFTQIISDGNLFNFFLLQHLLEDLNISGYLNKTQTTSGDSTYIITPKGIETLDFLLHKLPFGIRNHLDQIKDLTSRSIKRDRDISTYIEPGNRNSYISILEIKDGDTLLFSVRYISGSKKDALNICDNFKKNADKIYIDVTRSVIK